MSRTEKQDKRLASGRVQTLRQEIRRHDYLYYVKNEPEISDERYDELFHELEQLERQHPELETSDSPTHRVGAPPRDELPTVEHSAPMLSLDSDKEDAALWRFDERVRKALGDQRVAYVIEPKLDGSSVELVYENGVLTRAATRGDGARGEGVTENARTIGAVALRLREDQRKAPAFLSIRAEVMMSAQGFERLNAHLMEQGKQPFANPRNAAAGSLRQLDSRITASRALDIFVYDILVVDGIELKTHWQARELLAEWGLKLSDPAKKVGTVEEILEFHRSLLSRRDELEHEIDGVVVKLDSLAARDELGVTARHPRWAYAHKFPARKEETQVLRIVPSVGRTGTITPIAMLRPVEIGGVTVARASMHNREEVARKDVREGDRVRVQRAGDVIPQVVERISSGGERGAPFQMPARCPSCEAGLVERGPYTICPNSFECPAQQAGRLIHFASRDALDIDGLGEETARLLVNVGLVRRLPELFDLTSEQLQQLEGFGKKAADNLIGGIEKAANVQLDRFVYGLGVPDVGRKVAKDLAAHFGSLNALRRASVDDLTEVEGVGRTMAEHIVEFLRDERTQSIIDELLDGRVTLIEQGEMTQGSLAGLKFVFTGSLEGFSRKRAQELVEANGARITTTVSPRTDYVVAGSDPGSKLDRARKHGVAVLDEEQFVELLREKNLV